MHLLVIEDNMVISLAIQSALGALGFTSMSSARGEREAISEALKRPPDLITCDVDLDPGNGLDAIEAILVVFEPPIIFITSSGDAVRARYPSATIVDKPFLFEELVDSAHELLGRRN